MVDRGVGGRGCRRGAAGVDDRCAALADGRQEGVAVPDVVVDQILDGLAVGGGEAVVGVHGRRVVAPHDHLFDRTDRLAGLGGNLRQGAVVVQAQHGGEVLGRQVRGRLHGDVGVGVGRVADHQHFDVTRSDGIQGLALHGEDLSVGFQQVLAFHARTARTGADQQGDVGILEGGHRVAVCGHAGQQRECAVVDLHHDALERLLCFLVVDLEQLQDDGLVLAQHVAVGDAEQQGIADLAGRAGHSDAHWGFSHDESPKGFGENAIIPKAHPGFGAFGR